MHVLECYGVQRGQNMADWGSSSLYGIWMSIHSYTSRIVTCLSIPYTCTMFVDIPDAPDPNRATSFAAAHVPHLNLFSTPPSPAKVKLQVLYRNNNTSPTTQTVSLPSTTTPRQLFKMPSAKYTQTYEKVSKMGEKLKAAGKTGPNNDEQLHVRLPPIRCTMRAADMIIRRRRMQC